MVRLRPLFLLPALALSTLLPATAAHASAAKPAIFDVGTAVVDISPTRPQYLGGYEQMDKPTGNVHDPLQVRAFFVAHGRKAVAFAIVDTQGWFSGYQEGPFGVTDARQQAGAWLAAHGWDAGPDQLIVSSTHSHAAPTIMGIWGPTDPVYLKQVHDATVQAIESASQHLHRAELWTGSGSIDDMLAANYEGTDSFDGWGLDDRTPVLWARDPRTGATLGLYANVPVHPDQFRGSKYNEMSADYPGEARAELDKLLGGTAVIADGTLGRQESQGGEDDYPEVQRQGHFVTNAITHALAHARPITSTQIAGATQYIATPAHNAALLALLVQNQTGFSCNDTIGACTIDRSVLPPYMTGNVIGTWVTALRIGDLAYVSEPGEAFNDVTMAIRDSISGASAVNVVGMAQDQLGYYYPPEDYPASEINPSDFIIFNVSPALADENVDAAALDANAIGFSGTPTHPMIDDQQPHAFFEPGVHFYPGVVESASPSVTFLIASKPSGSPVLPGQPDHTVSPAHVDFGDGTKQDVTGEQHVTHTFPGPGTYQVTATATDEQGQTRTWTRPVIIDVAPTAVVGRTVHRGVIELSARIRGGDGHAIAAHWTFADGSTADGLTVERRPTQSSSGSVTVIDGAGDSASAVF